MSIYTSYTFICYLLIFIYLYVYICLYVCVCIVSSQYLQILCFCIIQLDKMYLLPPSPYSCALMAFFGWFVQEAKYLDCWKHAVQTEVKQGYSLPCCSSSSTVNKYPFEGLFHATFLHVFPWFCCLKCHPGLTLKSSLIFLVQEGCDVLYWENKIIPLTRGGYIPRPPVNAWNHR